MLQQRMLLKLLLIGEAIDVHDVSFLVEVLSALHGAAAAGLLADLLARGLGAGAAAGCSPISLQQATPLGEALYNSLNTTC